MDGKKKNRPEDPQFLVKYGIKMSRLFAAERLVDD